MRGGVANIGRGGPAVRPINEATAITFSLPAPYKGWNAIGNLANMDPLQAVQMDNIFPGVQDVAIRKGYINWATGAPANIHALLPYNGPSVSKLFAATDAHIYDVTANAPIGASVYNCTSGYFSSTMITTPGGSFMFCVNGSDAAVYFDGTTWTVPSITGTGVNTANWKQVLLHAHRIWSFDKNSMNLWYLGTDSIAGPASIFPVGDIFKRGGYVVAIGTYTVQFYYGPEEYFAIYTSNGEIALYSGTDPDSSASWNLAATYDIAAPLGDHPLYKYGADNLLLTQTGLLPLSKIQQAAQQDVVVDQNANVSYTIQGAFLDAAASYSINKGWQIITHKSANLLIVNIPVSTDTLSYQFVMNTTTKAWCRFTNWNASCWAEFNGNLYFAGGTTVAKAWTGFTDNNAAIVGVCAQAYNRLGRSMQKNISLIRPNFAISGSCQVQLALDADFNTFGGQSIISYVPVTTGSLWDIGLWDSGIWDSGGTLIYEPQWTTVPGNLGYLHSLRIQATTSTGSFLWTSSDFAYRPAGIL